ncbi:MAG: hypothetical protein HYT19_01020 [Candidatus Nealsonbacteria bacterium]|nr:hypothetical protein [Candidatus Nealsonbacteria bacterium]
MILTTHILIGAAIAIKTQNPILGLSFAFISHYFADAIPHREYHVRNILEKRWKSSLTDFTKLSLDISLGFFLIMIISKNYLPAFLGGFFAILPDILFFIFTFFPKIELLKLLNQLHEKTHWFRNAKLNKKTPLFLGILTQVLASLLAISIFPR